MPADPARPGGLLDRVERGCDAVFIAIARLCGWVLVGLALLISADIVLRELRTAGVIDFNWQFVSEWSAYLVVLVVFAGLAYTLRSDGHITVSLLVRHLPARIQAGVALAMAAISEVVLVYMLYRGILWMELAIKRGITSTSVLKTPMWIPNLFVVGGLALFALAVLLYILRTARDLLASPGPADAGAPVPSDRSAR